MTLEDYMVPISQKANICFDCQKACGGCSWTAVDPVTNKLKFEPVPGWTAKPVTMFVGCNARKKQFVDTYHITACPEFVRDEKRTSSPLEVTPEQFFYIMARWRREGELE